MTDTYASIRRLFPLLSSIMDNCNIMEESSRLDLSKDPDVITLDVKGQNIEDRPLLPAKGEL